MSASSKTEAQAARSVMMIRPAAFAGNAQTAASNTFQAPSSEGLRATIQQHALMESEALAQALSAAGVDVHMFDDSAEPAKPDAVFADNWVSFHANGTVVLYPMLAPNRRSERRLDLIERLKSRFSISRILDLSSYEACGQFLEGMGSLVLDRNHRIAYLNRSSRTHSEPAREFGQQLGYQIVGFDAADPNGRAIYHTNVMLCIGPTFAVIAGDLICEAAQREHVLRSLQDSGHELIQLSFDQVASFAGNMLALQSGTGEPLIALSATAWSSLMPAQRSLLERHGHVLATPVPTIEHYGGGSVRCMLADIHLAERA